jgi:hypothetical protein
MGRRSVPACPSSSIHRLGSCLPIPQSGRSGTGEPRPPSPAARFLVAGDQVGIDCLRSTVCSGSGSTDYGRAVWMRGCRSNRSGNGHSMAPSGLPPLLTLALEIRRPLVCREHRKLIREMSSANPLWGAPRTRGELIKLAICAASCPRISTITKAPVPIFHSIRIAPILARSCHPGSEEYSPSRKSVACITATNVSPPNS